MIYSWYTTLKKRKKMYKNRESNMLMTRIAERKSVDERGLYKILDRDRFFARHYIGAKSLMDFIDISTTGCAFKINRFIPKGSYIEIELNKLSEGHLFESPTIAACEAVYCRYIDHSTNRVGAKFLEIDHSDIDRIRAYTE